MKIQLHVKDDVIVLIKIVSEFGYKDFEVCEFKQLLKVIREQKILSDYHYPKFKNQTEWTNNVVNKVIKYIFEVKQMKINNKNILYLYRKGTGDELSWKN